MANESGEAVMIILSRSGMLPQEKTSLSIVAILHLWRVWHGLLIVKALLQGALMLQYRYGSLTPVILSTPVDWARPENCLATAGAPRTSLDAPEVTAARGSEEGVDHFSASGEIGVGNYGRSCTRRRARLASCLAAVSERPTTLAISSKGTAKRSCSTNARRSAGFEVSRTTRSARPTESASSASYSGSIPSSRLTIGSGTCTSRGSSRRELRERSMSRHTRATTVVSHPPRFSTPLVPERLRWSQDSCTASSASVRESSIRLATARR